MPKIIVEIMPKQDLLDPQGKAVANALVRGGNKDISGVRIGKRIELHFDREVTEKDIDEILEKHDIAKDNQISFEEFKEIFKDEKELVRSHSITSITSPLLPQY